MIPRPSTWLSGIAAAAVAIVVSPLGAQEIVQAVVLDLTVLEVQVIVAATRGDETLQCLIRSADRERVAVERPVTGGFASGRTTIVSLPLPLLGPGESEFRVALVRDGRVLAQTQWRPLFPR